MAALSASVPFNLSRLCLERLRNFGRPQLQKSSERQQHLSISLNGLHRGPTDLRSFVKRCACVPYKRSAVVDTPSHRCAS